MPRRLQLVTEGRRHPPWLDTAISRAMLLEASAGNLEETFRIHVPGRVVAFGKRDTIDRRYPAAVAAATAAGFAAVERMAGGRAAVFTEHTLSFAWTIPNDDPRPGITERFRTLASVMVDAFARLEVPSEVGEIAGEYCPGTWSVHHDGRLKLMGVGQRLARQAAHIGGVVVVDRPDLVRRALMPVYAALGLEWRPDTAGALTDVAPSVTVDTAMAAVIAILADRYQLVPSPLAEYTLERAALLAPTAATLGEPR
ncbi:MAG: lipoate--protein ligase family protein [Actinomycetota bacterium]|nr:lipoate--protein ligase family protein [Actinomycetota bacterium]